MPPEQEMRLHRCCFTGHRPEKLAQSAEEVQQWLAEKIKDAIADGYLTNSRRTFVTSVMS